MSKKSLIPLAGLLCLLSTLAMPVTAAEVESGSVYCFSAGDFSQEEQLDGICITHLPEAGELLLGRRVLCPGDILTAEQLDRVTFSAKQSETDFALEVGYLPVIGGHAEKEATMTLSIRGKEDKAPIAEDCALETYKNLELTGKLKVSDPEGQSMTFSVVRQPKRGTVAIQEDGTFTYTPKKNKVGVDSFTFTATDPAGKVSREATVTITLLKPTEAAQYTDTLGKDCRFAAEWMKHTGIFVGENVSGNPCFSPEKAVTRGEFVTMLVKTLDIPTDEALSYTGYADEIPLWLQPYVAAAVRAGLTAGLPDQEAFGAELAISGREAAVLLGNALDREYTLDQAVLTRGEVAQILYECVQLAQEGPMI